MAIQDDLTDENAAPKKGSAMGLIIAMVLLTVVGGGLGAGFGMFLADSVNSEKAEGKDGKKSKKAKAKKDKKAAEKDKAKEAKADAEEEGDVIDASKVVALNPVVSNLAGSNKHWIRLEASVALIDIGDQDREVVLGHITEDILAFVRSLTVEQLEGSAGLEHLHEDLTDVIRTRTKSQANRLIIRGLIVE